MPPKDKTTTADSPATDRTTDYPDDAGPGSGTHSPSTGDPYMDRVTRDLEVLRKPFPPEQIGKLPRSGGVWLDYVGHADVTNRLLDADPFWTWEPFAVDQRGLPALDETGGLWIRLTVVGVTRIGYGDAGGKKGPNAVKEAIGDALRNAAMRFGVALNLWAKGDREFGIGHDSADAGPPPMPGYVRAVWDAIGRLDDNDKGRLREWCVAEGIAVTPTMTETDADAVVARAKALEAR